MLLRLLAEEPPKASEISALALDEAAAEPWRLFRLLARAQAIYGRASLGPFIISMTRGPADLLTVLLLARWAGGASGMQIVPLSAISTRRRAHSRRSSRCRSTARTSRPATASRW